MFLYSMFKTFLKSYYKTKALASSKGYSILKDMAPKVKYVVTFLLQRNSFGSTNALKPL